MRVFRFVRSADGELPSARNVRCALEGDAFCEWELIWSVSDHPHRDTPATGLELR